jgi:hypothetical protein
MEDVGVLLFFRVCMCVVDDENKEKRGEKEKR